MWPPKPNSANPDSDQSISDDEELGPDWHGNCVSLATSASKKEGSEILSRLEQLKGTHEIGSEIAMSLGTPANPVFEDDVEMPDFYNEDNSICTPEKEMVEDENENDSVEKNGNFYGWSSISKEAESLIHLNENASSRSNTKKSSNGIKAKVKGKAKFSFGHQSSMEGRSSFTTSKPETKLGISDIFSAIENRTENIEDIHDEHETVFHEEALEHERSEQSMATLLDGLRDWKSQPGEKSTTKRYRRGKNVKLAVKRNKFPARGRDVKSEVPISHEDYTEPSSNSETSDEDLEIGLPDMKKQTIADQFREVFGATFSNENPNRTGLSGRLQQVMLTERERETQFLEKLGNGEHQNEPNCIYVEVMSRSLEGKLTVCRCFVNTSFESLKEQQENVGSEKTIIFSNRVSVDVELEVGSHICVHPPWQEVRVGHKKSIILATCFSGF